MSAKTTTLNWQPFNEAIAQMIKRGNGKRPAKKVLQETITSIRAEWDGDLNTQADIDEAAAFIHKHTLLFAGLRKRTKAHKTRYRKPHEFYIVK